MTRKTPLWLSVALAAALALAPALAEARAGGGKSSGSRGSRTYEAPQATPTAPQARPMERSAAPQQAQRPGMAPQAQGGFFQRNPFLGGLLGGIVGAGLIGMLMGSGFLGAGFAGMLGMLLQLALIGGLIYLAVAFFRRRREAAPAYAGSQGMEAPMQRVGVPPVAPLDIGSGRGGGLPARGGNPDELGIRDSDFGEFERLLAEVQAAWSKGDVGKLRQLATPEMVGYFTEELSANAARGIENHIEDVRLEQGDLSEAWREDGAEYATVAMRYSMLDYGKRTGDGRVAEGSDRQRTEATEFWTLVRAPGGRWTLSAIQQAA